MFATATNFSRYGPLSRKEDCGSNNKSRNISKKVEVKHFSLCESLRITILQCRIAYISTHNTEIFNGMEVVKEIEQEVKAEIKQNRKVKK